MSVLLLSYLQTAYEVGIYVADTIRQQVYTVARGGRDMNLLTNNMWVDSTIRTPSAWVQWTYTYETHELRADPDTETERLGWLSVFHNDEDMGDFFSRLRITRDKSPTDEQLIMLYSLQKGWIPSGTVQIILPDASEKDINCSAFFSKK